MEKRALLGRLETKFATTDTNTGEMTGYGAVFGNVDSYGDIIAPGAFADTIAEHKSRGSMPLMLLNHAIFDLPIGVWDDMAEDDYGLKLSGHFIDNSCGQDAYRTAKAGAITGLSIGFIVTDFMMKDGHRVITGVKLLEVSLVTLPANDLARVQTVKSQENDMTNDRIQELEDLIVLAKSVLASLDGKLSTKSDGEEGDDCEDDSDCDDDCECGDDGECECLSCEQDRETKYLSEAMSAIAQVRRELNSLFQ